MGTSRRDIIPKLAEPLSAVKHCNLSRSLIICGTNVWDQCFFCCPTFFPHIFWGPSSKFDVSNMAFLGGRNPTTRVSMILPSIIEPRMNQLPVCEWGGANVNSMAYCYVGGTPT